MAGVTATTLANGVPSKWNADFDLGANEEMVFANKIKKYPMERFGTFYVPFIGTIAGATQAAGSGSSLSFTGNTEGRATMTAATRYTAVELERQAAKRAVSDPKSPYKKQLQAGLGTTIDADCLQDVSTLVTNIVNAAGNIGKAELLDAYALGAASAREFWVPGEDGPICIVHNKQIDDIMSISDLTSAQVRGDSTNPMVRGWLVKALGTTFYESGSVYTNGANAYNVMFIPRAFGIAYNWQPMFDEQAYQLTERLIASSDFAHVAVREQYAIQIISPNT